VGPRDGMDALEKKDNSSLLRKQNGDSSVVQPVVWLLEDCAILPSASKASSQ